MTTGSIVRWGAISALIGGASFVALALESIVRPEPERYRTALFLVPWGFSAGGIVGLHALQRRRVGRLGRVGFWATIGAMATAAVGTAGRLAGRRALVHLEAVGVVGWTAGMLILGVATARARVVPAWAGVALAAAEPTTVAVALALSPRVPLRPSGSYSGAVANGAAFLALGVALRSRRGCVAAPQWNVVADRRVREIGGSSSIGVGAPAPLGDTGWMSAD